ncbi:hypothetical protein [Lactobacillus delbrueckii]|uniref:hypothetical protein n=1 Tax=Lactobacillus delbrueckii TaxID=1584 RepID=UPI001E33423D|nr:hypothetical protein [Lactobacillus delbrueckii]
MKNFSTELAILGSFLVSNNGKSASLSFDIDDVLVGLIISSEQRPCAFLLAKLLNFQGTSPLL